MAVDIAFVGVVVHSTIANAMCVLDKAILGIKEGKVFFLENVSSLSHDLIRQKYDADRFIFLSDGEFLMPGLVDTHIHAAQTPNAGIGYDLPLLQWLNTYTFPTEAMYSDVTFAKSVYQLIVRRLLECGTTTALYHATIHVDSTLALCRICDELGQRAFVGKVCMDQDSPDYLIEGTQESLDNTRQYLEGALQLKSALVSPCVIPRFALACSDDLMIGLAQLAQEFDVIVQSHMCENRKEVELVLENHVTCKDYTDVYDSCGLLDNKCCSMAHCVYMDERQMAVLRQKDVGVSHCPNSNMSLKSGLCDVRALLDHDIKVGLGTDVSGGFQTSILDALRMSCQTSNILGLERDSSYRHIDYKEAFRMATLGGSQVLGLDKQTGNFEVGKEFDALRVNTKVSGSPCLVFQRDTVQDIIQKFLYTGDDRNIVCVYVGGKLVVDKTGA